MDMDKRCFPSYTASADINISCYLSPPITSTYIYIKFLQNPWHVLSVRRARCHPTVLLVCLHQVLEGLLSYASARKVYTTATEEHVIEVTLNNKTTIESKEAF